jgi:hypothetical protein
MAEASVLEVLITGNSTPLTASLTKATTSVKTFATKTTSLGNSMGGVFTAAAVGIGALAVGAIAKGIQATTEWAGEVRSLQRVTGLAAEDASRLADAGNQLGISVNSLNIGFGLLAKNLVNGSTNFDKYNIATQDAQGNTLPFLDVLGNISDKFATLKPGADQAAFAMNVFGRSGKTLIPILQRGSDGLQELYDKAQAAGLVMGQDTLDAAKRLSIAQRQLGDAAKGAAVQIGVQFVPAMADLTEALTIFATKVAPIVADALTPVADALSITSEGVSALLALLPDTGTESTNAAKNMKAFNDELDSLATGVMSGKISVEQAAASYAAWSDQMAIAQGHAVDAVDQETKLANATTIVQTAVKRLGDETGATGHRIQRFAGLTGEAFKTFKTDVMDSVRVTIGQFDSLNAAFSETPKSLKKALDLAVKIAKTEQADIRTIFNDKSIRDGQKEALLQMPPEFRRAFVEAGAQSRDELAKQAEKLQTLNKRNFDTLTAKGKAQAASGGQQVGHDFAQGMADGLRGSQSLAVTAAAQVAKAMMDAARAELQAKSPSKKGMELGEDYVKGIAIGLQRASRLLDIGDALRDLIHQGIKHGLSEADAEWLTSWRKNERVAIAHLTAIQEKLSSFRDTIRGAFSDIGDLGGTVVDTVSQFTQDLAAFNESVAAGTATGPAPTLDISAAIQEQVKQARTLAHDLKAAAKAGLSKDLIAQFAEQGAAAIPALEQLLSNPELIRQLNQANAAISKAAGDTAELLGDRFFGDAVRQAALRLVHLQDQLEAFVEDVRDRLNPAAKKLTTQFEKLAEQMDRVTGGKGGGKGIGDGGGDKGPTVINVYGDVLTEGQLVEKIDKALAQKRRRNGRLLLD